MLSITLTEGSTTVTMLVEARLSFPPAYNLTRKRYLSGRETYSFSGPFVQGQVWGLRAALTEGQVLQLMRWANARTLLTLTDTIDDNAGTCYLLPELQASGDRYYSKIPFPGAGEIGWVEDYALSLVMQTITKYRGRTEDLPLLQVPE